jgi:hypothetical protein
MILCEVSVCKIATPARGEKPLLGADLMTAGEEATQIVTRHPVVFAALPSAPALLVTRAERRQDEAKADGYLGNVG